MKVPQQTIHADEEVTLVVSDEEATLVSPRFDDEETLVARPVVPLAESPAEAHAPAATAPRRTFAPRRSWPLALMLASVLIGGVLGGAGLYLFQRQSQDGDSPTAPQAETQTETQPEAQPQAAPPTEASSAPQPDAAQPDIATTQAQPDAQVAEPAPDAAVTDATPARERENVPAAERRDASSAAAVAPKRGKKGERDEEINRQVRRERRPDSDAPVSRADDDPRAGERQARRVDSIFYRSRRAARRARRDDDTDRLRRIFEGSPE